MNPASRLLAVSRAAAKIRPNANNTPAAELWPTALSAINISEGLTERELARHLDALITQAEIVEQLLEDFGVPTSIYERHLTSLKASFSPIKLQHGWPHIASGFNPEILTTLEWASWTLKEREIPIEAGELQSLFDQLKDLQNALKNDGIPKPLKIMVRRQLEEIQQAIAGYSITGIEPLKDALNRAAGEFSIERETIKKAVAESTEEQKAGLAKFQKFATKAAGFVEKAASFAGAVDKLQSYGSGIATALKLGG